jgi:hypothetical protein
MRLGTLLLAASCVAGCKIDLDHGTKERTCMAGSSSSCMDAMSHQELSWLQKNVFTPQCASFAGCHNGDGTKQGKIDLRDGHSYTTLVNGPSTLLPGEILVVPGEPSTSYLEVMVGSEPGTIDPSVGLMPQTSNGLLCCQKLDAITRWIMNGAMND